MNAHAEHTLDSPPKKRGIWRRLAWTAGLMGGLMSSLAEAARVGHGRGRQESERQIDLEQSLSDPSVVMRLDQRLMGRSKEEIVTSLGPPLAASMQERAVIEAGVAGMAVGSFWETDTWYYPFRPRQQAAVAIVFQADRVVKVDLIVIPQ